MSNSVVVQQTWPDGYVLTIQIEAANSYPDALDQAKRTAMDAFAESWGVINTAAPEAD